MVRRTLILFLLLANALLLAIGLDFIKPDDKSSQPLRAVSPERIAIVRPDSVLSNGNDEIAREDAQQKGGELSDDTIAKERSEEMLQLQENTSLEGLPTLSDMASNKEPEHNWEDIVGGNDSLLPETKKIPFEVTQSAVEKAAKEFAVSSKENQNDTGLNTASTTTQLNERQGESTERLATEHSESCIRIGPFNDQWFARLSDELTGQDVAYVTERKLEQVLPLYRVFQGPFLTSIDLKNARETLKNKASSIEYYVFKDTEDDLPYISFGVFSSKDRARDYSAKLIAMGLDVSARQEGEKVVAGFWVVMKRGDYKESIEIKLKKVRYRVLESDCFSLKR